MNTIGNAELSGLRLDFSAMQPTERAAFLGYGVAQPMQVKLNYLEHGPRYGIGFFADHTGGMFRRESLPAEVGPHFFNYFMQFTSLPEIGDIISYGAEHDLLPRDVLIVLLNNPSIGDGLLNYKRRSNLSHKMLGGWHRYVTSTGPNGFAGFYEWTVGQIKTAMSLRNIWTNIASPVRDVLVFEPRRCAEHVGGLELAGWARLLPAGLQEYTALASAAGDAGYTKVLCHLGKLEGLGHDGSAQPRISTIERERHKWPERNALKPKHADFIIEQIVRIDRIARKMGRKAVFVVPPVLGERPKSEVNRTFTGILKKVPDGIRLIDDRFRFQEQKFFERDDEHPGHYYFQALVKDIIRRGWLVGAY